MPSIPIMRLLRRPRPSKVARKLILTNDGGAVVHVRRRGWYLIPPRGGQVGPFSNMRAAFAAQG